MWYELLQVTCHTQREVMKLYTEIALSLNICNETRVNVLNVCCVTLSESNVGKNAIIWIAIE